jgi:SAM-dependent methyltransferase
MPGMICRICGNSANNREFRIREMMLGFRDEFSYFECSKCGCLQISDIPRDIEKYYPPNYHALSRGPLTNLARRFAIIRRDKYALFNAGLIGRLVSKRYPNTAFEMMAKTSVNLGSRILDVGCGSGGHLYSLRHLGFKNLVGVDPYVSHEVTGHDLKILRATIHDLSPGQQFDVVIFDHSFEHIPDQVETLLKVSVLLSENGVCVIRMPIKTEHIWNRYNVDWVQADAPRHLFIHTLKSFDYLTREAGLAIKDVTFDSTAFQFWGSEQYRRDIPLRGENSYAINRRRSIFTAKQIAEYEQMAKELNRTQQGDQAAFSLARKVK